MKKFFYEIMRCKRGYGIRAEAETGEIVGEYKNITYNISSLANLVRLCNKYDLDIIHIEDVIDDFKFTEKRLKSKNAKRF